MKTILTLIIIGILVESIVEVLKGLYENKKFSIDNLMSIIVGLAISFTTNVNILNMLELDNNPIAGIIVTGLLVSRGSNYIHDIINKINSVGNNE